MRHFHWCLKLTMSKVTQFIWSIFHSYILYLSKWHYHSHQKQGQKSKNHLKTLLLFSSWTLIFKRFISNPLICLINLKFKNAGHCFHIDNDKTKTLKREDGIVIMEVEERPCLCLNLSDTHLKKNLSHPLFNWVFNNRRVKNISYWLLLCP